MCFKFGKSNIKINIKNKNRIVLIENKDLKKELRETEQEVMIDLKLKTDASLKKLKEQARKNRVTM